MKTSLKKYLIYEYRNGFTYRIKRRVKRHGNFEKKKQNKTKNQNLTKQLNSVNLISAYIKFSAEFSKLRRDLRISSKEFTEGIVIVPWIQAWSWGGFVGRVGPGTYSVISVTHTLGIALGESRITQPWCSPPLKTPP